MKFVTELFSTFDLKAEVKNRVSEFFFIFPFKSVEWKKGVAHICHNQLSYLRDCLRYVGLIRREGNNKSIFFLGVVFVSE